MQIEIKKENGKAIASISGEIDHHNAKELRTKLDKYIISSRPAQLVIDLQGITFMDSSGIGLIMGRSKLIKACGGRLFCKDGEEKIETGIKKVGAMLGDYVEVGCNSVLNPGTMIGRHSNIYPTSCVRGVIHENSIHKNDGTVIEKH